MTDGSSNKTGDDSPSSVEKLSLFPDTRWDILKKLRDGLEPESAEALEILCRDYREPIYTWLRRRFSHEDAEDITQEFFVHRAIRLKLFLKADAGKGKLRSLLLRALSNHVNTYLRLNHYARSPNNPSLHRSLDQGEIDDSVFQMSGTDHNGSDAFASLDLEWAGELHQTLLRQLEHEYCETGKLEIFEVLSWRIGDTSKYPYAEDAAKLQISPNAARVLVYRMRKRYDELEKLLRESLGESP